MSASQSVHDTIGSPDRSPTLYPALWRQLFSEPERQAVYAEVNKWLTEHLR